MFKAFLVKYAEIGIKGKNRYLFEDALIRQMEYVLKPVEGTFHVTKEQGRIYVLTEGDFDYEEALEALKRVFGIAYICPVVIKEDQGYEQLEKDVVAYVDHVYPDKNKTFKMHVRRAKKTYPGTSMELNANLGGAIRRSKQRSNSGDECRCARSTAADHGEKKKKNLYLFRVYPGTWRYADRN